MSWYARVLLGLALATLLGSVAVLALPDGGVLGRAPSGDQALAFVSQAVSSPTFLGTLALGVALVLVARRNPPPLERLRQPGSLGPATSGGPRAQALGRVRAALDRKVPGAEGATLGELLVQAGVRTGASDIHIQPTADGAQVTLRIDGTLEPMVTLSAPQHAALINRIKVLGRLTHHVTGKPQDGQFTLETPDGKAEVRLSLLPTQHGEKAVLRLTGLANAGPTFDDLALPGSVRSQLTYLLERPQGLVYFTGPTGSGKTTSIYASVAHLQVARGGLVQIATIEDPIEFSLPGVAQTQVNRATGLDFASGLRAILRQDPNVLVVGEIRDVETARIATQAALTGHLILTTVHADSAAGVFNRLLEMGVEPSVLASVSLASFSQRLLRRLCPHCRVPTAPTADQRARLVQWGALPEGYFDAPGCEACGGTGVLGRTAVFEVLVASDALREQLPRSPTNQQLMALAVAEGMMPLRDAALVRAREGEASLAEVFRVAP